jgi:YbbR domain-containing protein
VRVRLRGNSDGVFQVLEEDIVAFVDLSEHDSEGVYKGPVEIEKSGTALEVDPLEVRVEPLEVTVALERKIYKSLEVRPSLNGFPPSGYQLSQYRLTPSTVEVEGPRSRVEDLTHLVTEDIEIAGRREPFSVRVRIVRPDPLIAIPGGDVVEFRGVIEESVILHTFEDVGIVYLDLPEDVRLSGAPQTGSIRVQGKQLDIESVAPEDIRLVADGSEVVGPGTYVLTVRPEIPRGLLVLRYDPTRAEVRVDEAQADER